MANVKCVNNHWYDANKYKTCPYCEKKERAQSKLAGGIKGYREPGDRSSEQTGGQTVAMPKNTPVEIVLGNPGVKVDVSAGGSAVTVGIYSKARGTAYVTGWFVAREGPVKGRDYRIIHGINRMGRGYEMDICIPEDEKITDKHCSVVYDGKSNKFFLMPGEDIVYLNGASLNEVRELKAGDEITVGGSMFEFIPFCREGHIWEQEKQSENTD